MMQIIAKLDGATAIYALGGGKLDLFKCRFKYIRKRGTMEKYVQ